MTDRVGRRVGNYHLISLLGQGGFAEVYLGEHIYLGSKAAIKLLNTQLSEMNKAHFLEEARYLVNLIHPHIVRVLDFGVEGETPFLVLDYAPHGSLRQLHPAGIPLPLMTIVNYTRQAAGALQYAHEQRLIHRDIKPENMLLGRSNEILLSDFGIAVLAQSSFSQSVKGVAGTAVYMAPEQFQGKPRPASDQYALGVVIYEWLCGVHPFKGTFVEIASQHLFVPPPSLRGKNPTNRLNLVSFFLRPTSPPSWQFRKSHQPSPQKQKSTQISHHHSRGCIHHPISRYNLLSCNHPKKPSPSLHRIPQRVREQSLPNRHSRHQKFPGGQR